MSKMVPYGKTGALPYGGLFDDRFFRSFFNLSDPFGAEAFKVDIKDQSDHYALEAELPGFERDQIDVRVDRGMLVISASREYENETKNEDYICNERRYGRVSRSFNLDGIDQGGIKASYKNGILSLTLPKEKTAQSESSRRIQITQD